MSTLENFYYKNIAQKVRFYRKRAGYSQEELSEILGKNLKYIGHIERCERQISNAMLIKIMAFFKIQPREFFDFSSDYQWTN